MDNPNDIELVQLALSGDASAFEHLFNRHYRSVYRLAYKWCGIREDAEDIAQEVFVKLAAKLKMFGQKAAFKTWLYRITINTAKDFIRKHATKRGYEAAFALEQGADNPGSPPEEKLAAQQLYRALDRLPQKQKAAVLLVLAEGMSHKEAARVLNCREAMVSWRIFQARKKLKTSLEHRV